MKEVVTLRIVGSVPFGTKGTVVDKYVYMGQRYIVVRFETGDVLDFGEASHPLISYKSRIKFI